jgi:3-oxoadipate enol-lactonase
MGFFCNGKQSLHYLQRGQGEPLVLIHGLGCSGADWAFQVAELEKRFRVIVPDLPGSGHSPPPRGEYSIGGFATAIWSLLDHLGVSRTNIIGFSLGGAVALEMAAQRPASVPRLGLINSLATYRLDCWHKWLEAHLSTMLVRLFGMRRAAWLLAARLFPQPWQRTMRKHAAAAVGAVPASSYLGMGLALARWAIIDRLDRLTSRILLIAAEHDFTPLAEKRELAAKLKADIVVVRGSRHATPFDSIEATNASLLALLTDQPLPPRTQWVRDTPSRTRALSLSGSIAEEHASLGSQHTLPVHARLHRDFGSQALPIARGRRHGEQAIAALIGNAEIP